MLGHRWSAPAFRLGTVVALAFAIALGRPPVRLVRCLAFGAAVRCAMRRIGSTQAARWVSALGLAALLAGCAGFSPDGGMSAVQDIAGAALEKQVVALRSPDDAEAARAAMRGLLRRPLSANAAVQLALLNNRD